MTDRARLEQITASISRDYPELARGLLANQLTPDDPLWEPATRAMAHVVRITGGDDRRMADCVESFVVTSLDFLRLQARFLKTGRYARASAAELSDLYGDEDRMSEYLDGLALTYAMWPNHARMLAFFHARFVPLVPRAAAVVEIGPGHGLFAAELLGRRADVRYVGVDISPRSISYSSAAFAASGIAGTRYELVVADATSLRAAAPDLPQFDAAICCEVLEHVDEPASLLRAVRDHTADGAPVFVSTVANMEAEDHVYLFHDVDDIRALLGANAFTVVADQPLALAGSEGMTPEPLNYSAVAQSARSL